MIEVPIPKDITKVKTTLIGPFSTRMVVCGLIAAAVDFAALTLVNAIMPGLSLLYRSKGKDIPDREFL